MSTRTRWKQFPNQSINCGLIAGEDPEDFLLRVHPSHRLWLILRLHLGTEELPVFANDFLEEGIKAARLLDEEFRANQKRSNNRHRC